MTLILLYVLFIFAQQSESQPQRLYMAVGQSELIPTAPNSPVGLGDGGILKIKDAGSRLQIIAISKGMTWIQVGPDRYQVQVEDFSSITFFKELRALLKKFKGLKAEIKPSQGIVIHGTLLRLSDWNQIIDLAHRHNQPFEMRAKIHQQIREQTYSWIKTMTSKIGVPPIQIHFEPELKIEFRGAAPQAEDSAIRRLQLSGFKIIYNTNRLPQLPSVQIEVVIAEVDKTFERELGIKWGESGRYTAQALPEKKWQALNAHLSALEARGTGQILAKPRLLSRSGEKAEFHAGGEIPIRISGWGSQNVQWKKHGIIMNFQPQADHLGAMKLQVEIEISIPNLSQMVGQLPTFETNRVKSQFDLAEKKTIVLSGLVRKSQSNSTEGLPFLSQIPVLGRLFGSPRFQSRETELIIFVTPEVYESNDPSQPINLPKEIQSL